MGGLAGKQDYYSVIATNASSGKVSGSRNIGGFVGSSQGDINNCYSSCNVSGNYSVGGLIGYSVVNTIKHCYSLGKVNGDSDTGGLVGIIQGGDIIGSYFCKLLSDQDNGVGAIEENSTVEVDTLSVSQMKQDTSFNNWNFSSIWEIENNVSYPCLKDLYDYPFILPLEKKCIGKETVYYDTVRVVPMECGVSSYMIIDGPEGMTMSDSVISWASTKQGTFDFTVRVEDENGKTAEYYSSVCVTSYDGDGNAKNPFQIHTLSQLDSMRYCLNSYFILMNDLDFAGSSYDSINSSTGWSPVGASSAPFSGSFNGSGHVLSGLYINNLSNTGLFGYVKGAKIDSLGLINCCITGYNYAGGIAGLNNTSTISNSYVLGNISGSNLTGGITSENYNAAIISNCYAGANISGKNYIGGISGENNSGAVIKNCYFTGIVTGNNYCGGITGMHSNSEITNCYAAAQINGEENVGSLVGGGSESVFSDLFYNNETWNSTDTLAEINGLSTAEMKQQSNFADWDFDNVWEITEGTSFPRLRGIYDYPVIVPDFTGVAKPNILYNDTVTVVMMEGAVNALSLTDFPDGMQLEDSVLTWMPENNGKYSFSITAEFENNATRTSPKNIIVSAYSGEGTAANPFQIRTIPELDSMRYFPDNHFILMNDLDFIGSTYDSISSSEGWMPIGTEASPFTVFFNGAGHTISNLYINRPDSGYVGLFGYIDNTIIDSLNISECSITGDAYVAGLAGFISSSDITDCSVTGKIVAEIGGVAGVVGTAYKASKITRCYANVSVLNGTCAGGLVGILELSTISCCYSKGNISSVDNDYIGGLVGVLSQATVINSYSTASVRGDEGVGGLAGGDYFYSKIKYSYSIGKVSGSSYVGGLIGHEPFTITILRHQDAVMQTRELR